MKRQKMFLKEKEMKISIFLVIKNSQLPTRPNISLMAKYLNIVHVTIFFLKMTLTFHSTLRNSILKTQLRSLPLIFQQHTSFLSHLISFDIKLCMSKEKFPFYLTLFLCRIHRLSRKYRIESNQ